MRGKNVCRTHGGASTGPRTEQGRAKCAEARIIHGNSTREKRKQNAASATKLLLLRDLGVKLGMFGTQPTGWAGRRPAQCSKLTELTTEELIRALLKFDQE